MPLLAPYPLLTLPERVYPLPLLQVTPSNSAAHSVLSAFLLSIKPERAHVLGARADRLCLLHRPGRVPRVRVPASTGPFCRRHRRGASCRAGQLPLICFFDHRHQKAASKWIAAFKIIMVFPLPAVGSRLPLSAFFAKAPAQKPCPDAAWYRGSRQRSMLLPRPERSPRIPAETPSP